MLRDYLFFKYDSARLWVDCLILVCGKASGGGIWSLFLILSFYFLVIDVSCYAFSCSCLCLYSTYFGSNILSSFCLMYIYNPVRLLGAGKNNLGCFFGRDVYRGRHRLETYDRGSCAEL